MKDTTQTTPQTCPVCGTLPCDHVKALPVTEGEMGTYCREKFQEFMKGKPLDVLPPKDNILMHLSHVQNCMSEIWAERDFLAVGTVERLGKAMNHVALAISEVTNDPRI